MSIQTEADLIRCMDAAAEALISQKNEIDRLRAALEEIADPCRHGWASNSMPDFQHIARAALGHSHDH